MKTIIILNNVHKASDEELQVGGNDYPKSFGLYKGHAIGEFDGSHVFSLMATAVALANGSDMNAATMPTSRVETRSW
jgi:hypothetical protein